MTDLITRIREALDEDERLAREAARWGDTWTLMVNDWDDQYSDGIASEDGHVVNSGNVMVVEGRHIARHDPARVLREVAAKREILELHQYQYEHPHSYCVSCERNPATTYVRQDGPWCPGVLALAKALLIEVE